MIIRNFLKSGLLTVALFSSPSYSAEYVITQWKKSFDKKIIEIELGDTIIFKNIENRVTHNVFSNSPGNEFEIKYQRPGTQTPIKFKASEHKLGEMLIQCAIHPKMKLKVKIVKKKQSTP